MKTVVYALVAVYLAVIAATAVVHGAHLVEPVEGYRLSIFWMNTETLQNRLDALVRAGRVPEAMTYAGANAASWALMALLAVFGAARPFLGPSAPVAHIRSSAVVLGGLASLVLLAAWSRPLLDAASEIPSASNALSSMPAYWLFGMAASAAIIASHISFLAHDAALWVQTRLSPRPAL